MNGNDAGVVHLDVIDHVEFGNGTANLRVDNTPRLLRISSGVIMLFMLLVNAQDVRPGGVSSQPAETCPRNTVPAMSPCSPHTPPSRDTPGSDEDPTMEMSAIKIVGCFR